MQAKIEEVIKTYLTMPTNYAILFNGERGSGKTYYAKNHIRQLATSTKTLEDQRKDYKFIYLSLYGVDKIDEIFTLIGLEILPFLKTKGGKVGIALTKILLRGLTGYHKLGELEKHLSDAGNASKQFIDTRDFVFVLDDIDRKSASLNINSLIGWVNSLVEHDNNKIILIADNEFINEAEYAQVKEKTVGITIEFAPEMEQQFDQLASKYDHAPNVYYQYLQHYKPLIIEILKKKETSNLRVLGYFFEHFRNIFYAVYDYLGLEKSPDENPDGMEKLDNLIRFALAISIEFRFGKLSYKEKMGLNNSPELIDYFNQQLAWQMLHGDEKQKENGNKSDLDIFLENYYTDHYYRYYESVYLLLTGGSGLDADLLKTELEKYFPKKVPDPAMECYHAFDYRNAMDFSRTELKQKLREVLDYAYEGRYSLDLYLSIFFKAEICKDYFSVNMSFIAKRLITSLEKHKDSFSSDGYLEHRFGIEQEREDYLLYKQIFKKTVEINTYLKHKQNEKSARDRFTQFANAKAEFYDWHNKELPSSTFEYWNLRDFVKVLLKMKPSEIKQFDQFLNRVYTILSKGDREMLAALNVQMARYAKGNTPRAKMISSLSQSIDNVVLTYSRTY